MSMSLSSGSDDENNLGSSKKSSVYLDFGSVKAHMTGKMAYIASRVTLDTVRPLNIFLGITGPSLCFSPVAFNAPVKKIDKSTFEKFGSRLKVNFAFFLSNYALVTAGVALVTALMNPGMVISVALIWSLWALHKFLISNELIIFGRNIGTLVSISHRSNGLIVLTAFVIVWKCLSPTITVISISGVMILVHALLRDPSHVTSGDFGTIEDYNLESSQETEVLVENPEAV